MDKKEYLELLEELKSSVKELYRGFYEIKKEKEKLKKKIDISRPFSSLNFPSKGLCYPDGKKSVLIRYLTAIEEHVLTDSFLVESGRGIELVLENIVLDGIDVQKLLVGDFQAILIFLRSTAYGDEVEISPTCPHCGKEAANTFKLSSLDFKEQKHQPSKDGKYYLQIPELELEIVISPMTFEKELKKSTEEKEGDYFVIKDNEGYVKVKKERLLLLTYYIDSINGIEDKEQIKKIIKKLPKKHVDNIIDFIKQNESGVQDTIELSCPFCGQEFKQATCIGYNFISLPYEYKQTVLEEIFLITYYGKSITRQDALQMPVYERKWFIRRIKEELDKKAKAEKSAYEKAKSKKGKF